MGPFYSVFGPVRGPVLDADAPGALGVTDEPGGQTPIATAIHVGADAAGVAVWKLILEDVELPGRWVIIDREFRPAP